MTENHKILQSNYPSIKKLNNNKKKNMRSMKMEPIIQREISQKEKHQYSILTHIYGIYNNGNNNPICKTVKEIQI